MDKHSNRAGRAEQGWRAGRAATCAMALATGLAAHAAGPAHEGADRGADEADGYRWGLGVSGSLKKSLYAGVGSETSAFPLISFDSRWVRVFGNQLDLKLPSYGPLDFSLRTQFAIGEGYKASDADELAGMAKRKGAILMGAATTWRNELADVSLVWLKDVSGHSKGSVFKLGAEHAFRVGGSLEIAPHAEFARYDGKYVDYYYGVRAEEATSVRPAYLGDASTAVQLGVRFGYMPAPRQRLLLDLSGTRYSKGITDSPIVERRSVPELRIGYLYAF